MSTIYYLIDDMCPYCGKIIRDVVIAPECDKYGQRLEYYVWACEHCGEKIKIDMNFMVSKLKHHYLAKKGKK